MSYIISLCKFYISQMISRIAELDLCCINSFLLVYSEKKIMIKYLKKENYIFICLFDLDL